MNWSSFIIEHCHSKPTGGVTEVIYLTELAATISQYLKPVVLITVARVS